MCEGCVEDGLITQKVFDAILDFDEKWPRAAYGPAHIVIGDQNVDDECIQWCLDHWNEHTEPGREEEYEATKAFLRELLTWPIEERLGPAEFEEV